MFGNNIVCRFVSAKAITPERKRNKMTTYKGYELKTTKDGKGEKTVAYLKGQPVYASYSELSIDTPSLEKCKNKIDGTRPSLAGKSKI